MRISLTLQVERAPKPVEIDGTPRAAVGGFQTSQAKRTKPPGRSRVVKAGDNNEQED